MSNTENELNQEGKRRLKILYACGGIFFLVMGGIILSTNKDGQIMHQVNSIVFERPAERGNRGAFDEGADKEVSSEALEVDMVGDKKKVMDFGNKAESAVMNDNPNLLRVDGHFYYLFNKNILLPLSTETWREYTIAGDADGKYGEISEFYLEDENATNWTQKFTVHEINSEDKNCFDFMDKLVNGLIFGVTSQLDANGIKYTEENLSFNYISKDVNNTLLYWEKKNIDKVADELQFIRVFVSPYSHKMYLVVYALRGKLDSLTDEDIQTNLIMLNHVQELKEKHPVPSASTRRDDASSAKPAERQPESKASTSNEAPVPAPSVKDTQENTPASQEAPAPAPSRDLPPINAQSR